MPEKTEGNDMTDRKDAGSLKFKVESTGEKGEIVGYGFVFNNKDSVGDIVDPKAFDAWLAKGVMPKMLWQHRADSPIGKWEKAEITEKGLKLSGRLLLNLAKAAEVYEYLKEDLVDGLSIGYRIKDYYVREDGGWTLTELDLKETSVVTFPANEEATITSVKTKPVETRSDPMDTETKTKLDRVARLVKENTELKSFVKGEGHTVDDSKEGAIVITKATPADDELITLPSGRTVKSSEVDPVMLEEVRFAAKSAAVSEAKANHLALKERAELELKSLAGPLPAKIALLKALDTISDEKAEGEEKSVREVVTGMLTTMRKSAELASMEIGSATSPLDAKGSAEDQLEALTIKRMEETGETHGKALTAVIKTKRGSDLYEATLVH